MPVIGVNNCIHILHMSKILLHCYTKAKISNQLETSYMINPSLKFNNTFIKQLIKLLGVSFSIRTMKHIKNCLMKKNTCSMELILLDKSLRT